MAGINSVLGRGSGGTVQTAAPPASDRANATAFGEFKSGVSDVTKGRVTLLMLDTLILLLVLFYLWTHRAQGGG
jgi:hypothetical protein